MFIVLSFMIRIPQAIGSTAIITASVTIVTLEFSDCVATTFVSISFPDIRFFLAFISFVHEIRMLRIRKGYVHKSIALIQNYLNFDRQQWKHFSDSASVSVSLF